MIDFLQNRVPIKLRLTLWYVLLMAVTFTAFAVYLVLRFQNNLKSAIDASLQINVSQTIAGLDEEDYRETGVLTFDHTGQIPVDVTDFAMRIISLEGVVWDTYGVVQSIPVWGLVEAGFSTQRGVGGEEEWRVYSQAILDSKGQIIGWVQASQSLLPVTDSVQDLQDQLLLGIPLILLLAGFGGFFLANRALLPIERITDTAQEITAQDLSLRLNYEGVDDEVGRLAQTFDQMLARLQSSFERERRFTSDTAHELRTPLTVLKGQIDVTLSRARNTSEYENKLRDLSTHVDRLIRLSNALLFLSRSDQNQLVFESVSVNLCDLLEVLVEQFRLLAQEKRLKLTAMIPASLTVYGDGDHLIRLFINILENALKYTPPDGQITITTLEGPAHTVVTIHNTGPGISREHLPHLFERFYRVDADRSSQTGGSGLGLSIAHEIAHLHGGRIDVRSEAGQGVTVSVHLPNVG
jgi:heavy metal sensor kinase